MTHHAASRWRYDRQSDWAGSPMSTLHHMPEQPQPIPVEQYADGTGYVIRLEVPGIDPASDLTVSVETGTIVVRAERRDNAPEGRQTEFRYGHLPGASRSRSGRMPGTCPRPTTTGS